jgi:hypothetical protein
MAGLRGPPGDGAHIQGQQGDKGPAGAGPAAQEEERARGHRPRPPGLGEQPMEARPLRDVLGLDEQKGPQEQQPSAPYDPS